MDLKERKELFGGTGMFSIVARHFWRVHVANTNYIFIKLILQKEVGRPGKGIGFSVIFFSEALICIQCS